MITAKHLRTVLVVLLLIALIGCVERTITVRTDPAGALVTVNDVEKGRTPVTFPFTWYGKYRVLIEHPQYETLETSRGIFAPIYQWPVIDFVTEVLLPFKFHDHRDWSFALNPRQPIDSDQLIDRAQDFRQRSQIATDPNRQ